MLAFLGDIHGSFMALQRAVDTAADAGAVALIQVGDFGFYSRSRGQLKQCKFSIPVLWIDGNHEQHEIIPHSSDSLWQVHDNCVYVPRGLKVRLDGRDILFLGGAGSIDKDLRLRDGLHWSPLENITAEQMTRALNAGPADIVVTHTPPHPVIRAHFDPKQAAYFFGVPLDWKDPNAGLVEVLWDRLGRPLLFCGHMHRSVVHDTCRILACEELYLLQ